MICALVCGKASTDHPEPVNYDDAPTRSGVPYEDTAALCALWHCMCVFRHVCGKKGRRAQSARSEFTGLDHAVACSGGPLKMPVSLCDRFKPHRYKPHFTSRQVTMSCARGCVMGHTHVRRGIVDRCICVVRIRGGTPGPP